MNECFLLRDEFASRVTLSFIIYCFSLGFSVLVWGLLNWLDRERNGNIICPTFPGYDERRAEAVTTLMRWTSLILFNILFITKPFWRLLLLK